MCITDPIADLLTRIRNGQSSNKRTVVVPASKLKESVCSVLKKEGYIEGYSLIQNNNLLNIVIALKYYKGVPVIESIKRVSKPGRRVYKNAKDMPAEMGGFGISIISTSKGLMTDSQARQSGHGGEVICTVT